MTVTFVCTGNTCRSPMAAAVARSIVAAQGLRKLGHLVEVRSAGASAAFGAPASGGAIRAAAEAGLDLAGHRSALLTKKTVARSDVIVCMERHHMGRVAGLGGEDKARLFADDSGAPAPVSDPFGSPDEAYRAVFRELEVRVGALFASTFTEGYAKRGRGRAYAVLGDPVRHSLSPTIHNAAFRKAGVSAVYWARPTAAADCGVVLRDIALAGGGGNVTAPHKERVVPFLDEASEAVAATGACNTFWSVDGKVHGDNTDVEGFLETWDRSCRAARTTRAGERWERGGPSVLVLGAGGAARAVLFALIRTGPLTCAWVWNRTHARAAALVEHFLDDRLRAVRDWRGTAPDLVVNATSVGLTGKRAPIDLAGLARPPGAVIDLVYGKVPSPLAMQAAALNVHAADGRDMLVGQAEASFRRWFGRSAPPGAMAEALR